MNKILVSSTALILCAGSGLALAGDDDNDGYDDMTGEAMAPDETPDEQPDNDGGGGGNNGGGEGGGGGGGGAYKMAIATNLVIGDGAHADFLWAMGKNWLDLGVGFSVGEGTPDDPTTPADEGTTAVGFDLIVGYRLVKPMKGRVTPYIKPFVEFGIQDFNAAGDTIIVGAGAQLGVDVMVFDQFSLGAAFGAGLFTDDAFGTINVNTATSSIIATIWW